MVHVALLAILFHTVQGLLIARRTERDNGHNLRLATLEDASAVRAREQRNFRRERAEFIHPAAIHALAGFQHQSIAASLMNSSSMPTPIARSSLLTSLSALSMTSSSAVKFFIAVLCACLVGSTKRLCSFSAVKNASTFAWSFFSYQRQRLQ